MLVGKMKRYGKTAGIVLGLAASAVHYLDSECNLGVGFLSYHVKLLILTVHHLSL